MLLLSRPSVHGENKESEDGYKMGEGHSKMFKAFVLRNA
jgi:hypothetical protein